MKIRLFTMVLVMAAQAAPALADEPTQKAAATADKPKLICRTEQDTASRTRTRRICLTREDWDRLSADSEKQLDDARHANDHSQAGMIPQNPR